MSEKQKGQGLGYEKLTSMKDKLIFTLDKIEHVVRPPGFPPAKEFFGRKEE